MYTYACRNDLFRNYSQEKELVLCTDNTILYEGICRSCATTHSLSKEPALDAAQQLMQVLEKTKRIDFAQDSKNGSPILHTDFLYTEALGKMFGVLVCEKKNGEQLTLKAFSGQYNGMWKIEGWVPPLFNANAFWQLTTPVEKQIKDFGKEMEAPNITAARRSQLQELRKKRSQDLMKQIHSLYRLHNFKNQQATLFDFFPNKQGAPTGTGDCCAPKLLNFAAIHKLKPLGLVEFYWGATNRSATRHQGHFYPACKDKCGPILGFLLCGIQEL
jgi:hypothetical protein